MLLSSTFSNNSACGDRYFEIVRTPAFEAMAKELLTAELSRQLDIMIYGKNTQENLTETQKHDVRQAVRLIQDRGC